MKLVFTAPFLAPCDWVKAVLQGQSIAAMLKNEYGHVVGLAVVGGAAAFCWPEVWVEDEDFARASEIVASECVAILKPGEPWKCRHCGETVDGELEECWRCGEATVHGATDHGGKG